MKRLILDISILIPPNAIPEKIPTEQLPIAYNEELVGAALKPYRNQVVIATKFGVQHSPGSLLTDSRPETICKSIEGSLKRIGTNHIDSTISTVLIQMLNQKRLQRLWDNS